MKRIGDFFKRIRVEEKKNTQDTVDSSAKVEIHITKSSTIFPNEEEEILLGAKQLLKTGKFKNLEEAVVDIAVNMRGLRFKNIEKTEDGKSIVMLEERTVYKENDGNVER